MKTNQDLKNAALEALRGNWAPAVVCTIIYLLLSIGISLLQPNIDDPTAALTGAQKIMMVANVLLLFLVMVPLGIGYYQAFKVLFTDGDNKLTANCFRLSFGNYFKNIAAYLLMCLFIFLWTLLLIIPGIIKALAYSMTPFILKDFPELSVNQAINLSQKMMKGHKFDYFWLGLSFIGWILLGLLTLGIGYIWLIPYMYTSYAAFYEEVKKEYLENTTL
jgi:uncharacterized membrane protein